MYYIEEVRKWMRQQLQLGNELELTVVDPDDGRKKRKRTFQVLIGLYPEFALFEDENGNRECFLYQDIFFQKEECRRNAKK